jgi:large subunit ribosomal protein L9
MKVIFLKDVPRVGRKNDVKEINDGYAINFLFPRKFAEPATVKTISMLEQRKKEVMLEHEMEQNLLLKNLSEIKGKTIVLKGKANEKGSLFSAIHKKEIAEAMKMQNNTNIKEEFIILEKPIKETGEFEIPVEIKDKKSFFKLVIERIL